MSSSAPHSPPLLALVLGGALLSCTGMVQGGRGTPSTSDSSPNPTMTLGVQCDPSPKPGRSPLRRLNQQEYKHTISDLLGVDTSIVATFPPDEASLGFLNNADALVVTGLLAESYMTAAITFATAAVAKLNTLLPCDPASAGEEVCALAFITAFGQRAFRRPLAADEVALFQGVYQQGRSGGGFADGIELAVEAFIQSPRFLYRVELANAPAGGQNVVSVDGYEMASRLSYFLWGTMPDAELFSAAASGKLSAPADIETEVRRMVRDPRARRSVAEFHNEWLGLGELAGATKDPATYPAWNDTIRAEVQQEGANFVDHVFWEDGRLETLLTAPYSYLNQDLAHYYGVSGPSGTAYERAEFPANQRAGILTQGALLSALAKPNQTAPVLRGKFVREMLLCQQLSPPPPNIVITPPDVRPDATTRQRFTQHSKDPNCAVCHQLMDPLGFGFENYDAVGQFRATDQGFPVDASGQLINTDVDGKFTGAVELAQKLATSAEVRQCLVKQWFRYAVGRAETDDDQCTLQNLGSEFDSAKHDMRELSVKIASSDAFRYRSADGGGN